LVISKNSRIVLRSCGNKNMGILHIMKDVTLYSILLTLMYLLSGINKILAYNDVVKGFQNKVKMKNLSNIIIAIVILLEIICPILIIKGTLNRSYKKIGRLSTYVLICFTILATYLYHFPPTNRDYYPFMSNMTAIGGLFLMSKNLE
jgi:uncharacterized membrane protein YphA (DoxX/SURF4 family)